MALKDLLVYVDQTENSFVRLRLAVDLAIRNDSHLTAIFVKKLNRHQLDALKAAELGLVSAKEMKSLHLRTEALIEAVVERLRSTLETLTRGLDVVAKNPLKAAPTRQRERLNCGWPVLAYKKCRFGPPTASTGGREQL
jgi:nucleotide-binding universal stress UspA family protein